MACHFSKPPAQIAVDGADTAVTTFFLLIDLEEEGQLLNSFLTSRISPSAS